jgi:hypothetical protein
LLRRDAEIDWWCTPRFDASPTFWSILDPRGAAARFIDVEALHVSETPIGPTAITQIRTRSGVVEVRDGAVGGRILRLVRALNGGLDLVHEMSVGGFDERVRRGSFTHHLEAPAGQWVALELREHGAGFVDVAAATSELDDADATAAADARALAGRHHANRVHDAIAVTRACTYSPTGATAAAPTTSIPEVPGADRQFDYRYAWLRDGSLAAGVAARAGRLDLAAGHLRFLCGLGQRLFDAPLFAVDGGPVPVEREVAGVDGVEGSRPVRVGNAAIEQMQYDALGFVVESVATYVESGGRLTSDLSAMVGNVADRCCSRPERDTGGIWELRKPRPLLSADIGRWLALDRAIRLSHRRPWMYRDRWRRARNACRDAVLGEVRPDGRIPQVYGGSPDDADASALLIVMFGMLAPDDPRARAIVDSHVRLLGTGPYLRRYSDRCDDGFTGAEGAFVPCCWWVVSVLALLGDLDGARERADVLCRVLPRLLPEEIDPQTGAGWGNFPLVWSHAELARAMHMIQAAEEDRSPQRLPARRWFGGRAG